MLVFQGRSDAAGLLGGCVTDPTATTFLYTDIGINCCDGSTCIRKTSASNSDCINGGKYGGANFEYKTYSEAYDACDALGYTLCETNDGCMGCGLKNILVWSGLECDPETYDTYDTYDSYDPTR